MIKLIYRNIIFLTINLDNVIFVYNDNISGVNVSYKNEVSNTAVGSGGIGDTILMYLGFYVLTASTKNLITVEKFKPKFILKIIQ